MTLPANVRKKGRPRVLSDEEFKSFRLEIDAPTKSYRATYEMQRFVHVAIILIEHCGEEPIAALADDPACRPKTVERFPWLFGRRIQHAVLTELYGLPHDLVIKAARHLERLHRSRNINARRGRDAARGFKYCELALRSK